MERRRRPNPWLKPLYRLPVWLYRMGLGWVFGGKLLLLVYRGRITGRRRYIVLEVAHYDKEKDEYTVMSGYGKDAHWYRSLEAHPALEVRTGRRKFAPDQRLLTYKERYGVWLEYEQRHRLISKTVPIHLNVQYDGSAEARRRLVEELRMVIFRPTKRGPIHRRR